MKTKLFRTFTRIGEPALLFPLLRGNGSRIRVLCYCILTVLWLTAYSFAQTADSGIQPTSPAPLNTSFNEEIAQRAFEEAIRPETAQVRTFYPVKYTPQELADRFLMLLPAELRAQTNCRADNTARTLTVSGPPQVVATADEIIPRMDANAQLSGSVIDYGLAAAQNTVVPVQNPVSEQPSEAYYDPNENRMVRTLSEPKNAILPQSNAQRGMVLLGTNQAAAPQGAAADQTPDIVLYSCPPQNVAASVAQLKQAFASCSEVTITSDAQEGKILVYTTRQRHEEVRRFLAGIGIQPAANDSVGFGTGAVANSASPAFSSSASASVSSPMNTNPAGNPTAREEFSPIYKNISVIEAELTGLLQTRLERIFPKDPNDPQLTPAEREKTIWRFTRRVRPNTNDIADECELFFNPREQQLTIAGNPRLVHQMKTLVESIDNSGKTGASHPRYILLKNADPNQIQEIFEVQRRAQPQYPGTGTGSPQGAIPLSPESMIRGQSIQPQETSAIRPVNWQEGDLGSLGASAASLGGSIDAHGPMGPPGPGQIDLVPDFVPMVLPDLDMVILDAPEAETKRIIEMIDKIEQLAAEAEPQTEIYPLKHVNSVMLGGVLAKLYTEMFATKQGRVLVYALQYPNAILLVGWGEAPKAMKTLIEMFDQPIQGETSLIEVVSLKFASAQEIATMLTTQFPTPQPESSGFAPRIRVIPDPRTNSLVIQAAPNDFEEIQKILMKLDVNTSESKLEVRTFPLKHSLAADIRASIAQAILPAMQGTLPAAEAKYPILQIMTVDAESRKLIESGIMRDVQVSADVQNNQLIVTAPSDCMDLMSKLIEMLDVAPAKAQIKIFPLRYADALQIQKTLQSLLPTGGGSMPAIPNADGENSFVPVRFALDTRMNCILVAASPLDLKIIDSLIIALDREDTSQRREEVIQLRNVQATAIAQAVNVYLNQKQQLELSSGSVSDYQLFDSQVIVVPETSTNSIIISATPKYLDEISQLVKSFDAEPASVVIQVLIAEVTLSDNEEFGIEAGLQDKIAFDRSLVTSVSNGTATANPGYDIIGNNNQGNNFWSETDPAALAGTAVSSLGMGRTNSDLGYGGLVLSASSNSIQVLLRALREKNRLQILSRPEIRAMDNQQAFILIGQRVPRIAGASSTTYGVTSNVTEANVGLILLVTPKVNEDGRVIMEIGAEKSSLGSDSDAIPVYTSGDQVIKSPTIDTTQIMTAVSAVNGETVMLGGLITNQKTKVSRGVPYISDIPVVGWLFRYDSATEERKELIIVMTPRVILNRSDSEQIKRVEASKMSWCLADAMAINGNMGLYNPLGTTNSVSPQTQSLQFLEIDKMEEIPPSAIKPYSPDKDYPDEISDEFPLQNDVPASKK